MSCLMKPHPQNRDAIWVLWTVLILGTYLHYMAKTLAVLTFIYKVPWFWYPSSPFFYVCLLSAQIAAFSCTLPFMLMFSPRTSYCSGPHGWDPVENENGATCYLSGWSSCDLFHSLSLLWPHTLTTVFTDLTLASNNSSSSSTFFPNPN